LPRAAVARVAESIARDLAGAPGRALVVAAPLVTDTPAPRGAELVTLVAQQLAGRRGAESRAHNAPLALAEAREAARNAPALVHLSIALAEGKLRVTADVYPVPRSIWALARDPEPGPVAHAFAEASIDAEVRTFLAPIPLVAANVSRARNFESDVVALACGDLDGDGATEIVSVSRRRVTTLRLREGKVTALHSRPWAELSPVHPAPLREPIGFVTLFERGGEGDLVETFADVGLSDRERSLRLAAGLAVQASFGGIAIPAGPRTGCVRTNGALLAGPVSACSPGDAPPAFGPLNGGYDAIAAASLVLPSGAPLLVWAGRNDRGVVELRDDAGHVTTIDGAGAQLAVGDLDQDGMPEILTSLDVQSPLEDAVVVRAWPRLAAGDAARPREIMRLPAAAGVHAIAVCPPDGPGRAPFAVATADEIWVAR
jgi:hypothetical protein